MATLYREAKRNGKKRILIVIICIIAAILLALMTIGIIAGNMGGEHEAISAAVSENVQMKQTINSLNVQLSEQQTKINELQAKIDELQAELGSRPTPTPAASPAATPQSDGAQGQISPRANR